MRWEYGSFGFVEVALFADPNVVVGEEVAILRRFFLVAAGQDKALVTGTGV